MEAIKEAAIRYERRLFTGKNHSECFIKAKRNCKQGFVTSEGRFVDRYEALLIAKKADQIKAKHPPFDLLLSEDLK